MTEVTKGTIFIDYWFYGFANYIKYAEYTWICLAPQM